MSADNGYIVHKIVDAPGNYGVFYYQGDGPDTFTHSRARDVLERQLFVSSYSEGGSSSHTVQPLSRPHVMATRGNHKEDDEAWGRPT